MASITNNSKIFSFKDAEHFINFLHNDEDSAELVAIVLAPDFEQHLELLELFATVDNFLLLVENSPLLASVLIQSPNSCLGVVALFMHADDEEKLVHQDAEMASALQAQSVNVFPEIAKILSDEEAYFQLAKNSYLIAEIMASSRGTKKLVMGLFNDNQTAFLRLAAEFTSLAEILSVDPETARQVARLNEKLDFVDDHFGVQRTHLDAGGASASSSRTSTAAGRDDGWEISPDKYHLLDQMSFKEKPQQQPEPPYAGKGKAKLESYLS